MSNRKYSILMVGMACCMAIMAICGMLFMMYSYTIRLQSMVGIVYEQDKAAAGELMKLMFSKDDMAKEGMAAAVKLGYTDKAFFYWEKVLYPMVHYFSLLLYLRYLQQLYIA